MQIVNSGEGQIESLKEILRLENPKKILLLHGNQSYKIFSNKVEELINFDYVSYRISLSEISIESISKGINFYEENNCDLVISVGGGSVIDFGKLISIFSNNSFPIEEYLSSKRKYKDRVNRLIAIPTTAGSGSEATHFAVVYDGLTKYSVAHKSLLPDYSIIDPELTYSLPAYQTAVSGMDALCQAIESYWNINSNKKSEEISIQAINLLLPSLEKAVNSPDRESRQNMIMGSYFSGKAINLTKTTAPHAISYPMTVIFGIPHGHAVSLTLSSFFEYNFNTTEIDLNDERGLSFLEKKMQNLMEIIEVSDINEMKNKIKQLLLSIGLQTNLKPLGIKSESDIMRIVENVNFQRLSNNPRIVRKSAVKRILNSIM